MATMDKQPFGGPKLANLIILLCHMGLPCFVDCEKGSLQLLRLVSTAGVD